MIFKYTFSRVFFSSVRSFIRFCFVCRRRQWTTYVKQSFYVSIFIQHFVVAATWVRPFYVQFSSEQSTLCVFCFVKISIYLLLQSSSIVLSLIFFSLLLLSSVCLSLCVCVVFFFISFSIFFELNFTWFAEVARVYVIYEQLLCSFSPMRKWLIKKKKNIK